jgi:hypothetical protein
VLTDIAGNLERLVRAEVRLATTGALDRVRSTVLGAALIAVGGMLWFLTTGLFMWGAVTRLSETMKPAVAKFSPLTQRGAALAAGVAPRLRNRAWSLWKSFHLKDRLARHEQRPLISRK